MTDDVAGEQPAPTDDAALATPRPSLPRRAAAWFSAQGVVAKFVVTIVTAVATALAVGVATRVAFDSGDGGGKLGPHEAPFTVSTEVQQGYPDQPLALAEPIPEKRAWPPRDADGNDLLRFFGSLGAVDSRTLVRIVLDGTAGRTSTITGARAVIVDRHETSAVALFHFPAQGELGVVGWQFDLDESGSPARVLSDPPALDTPRWFADRALTVAPGEAVTIDARASTGTCDCKWVIELDVVVDGGRRTVRVDDDGKPFHTMAAPPGVPEWIWAVDAGNRFEVLQPDGSYAPPSS